MEETLTIRTERTPNPNSLKYHVGRMLIPGGSANFPTSASAVRSPLAKRLFAVSGVVGVYIGSDFFTLTRDDSTTWPAVNEGVAPALESFFAAGEQVLTGTAPVEDKMIGAATADPAFVERVQQILAEKVRPAVAQDGGDIVFRGFENGIVYLEMQGSCGGCPSSSVTLKQGIETMLKHYCPEVQEVRAV